MSKYVVYKHTDPNGDCYIGITSQNPEVRWKNGMGYIDNKNFLSGICYYGWINFKHEILFKDLSLEEAEKIETNLIQKLKPKYNQNDTGQMRKIAIKNSLGEEFESISAAARVYKCHRETINKAVKENKQWKGISWYVC